MSEVFELDLIFESTSFSAQNPVDVTVVMFLNKTYVQQNSRALGALRPTLYLFFLGASRAEEKASAEFLPGVARIDLRLDRTFVYRGSTKLVYPVEGEYSVRLAQNIPESLLARPEQDQLKVIRISSIDSTYAIRNNNLILALTIAGIGLAVLQLISSLIKPKIVRLKRTA